jgi:hypothetical protein
MLAMFLDSFSQPTVAPVKDGRKQAIAAETPTAGTSGEIRRELGTEGAAKWVGLAKQTLSKLRVMGGGPNSTKIGTWVIYYNEDLDRWLAERRRRSTSDSRTHPRLASCDSLSTVGQIEST